MKWFRSVGDYCRDKRLICLMKIYFYRKRSISNAADKCALSVLVDSNLDKFHQRFIHCKMKTNYPQLLSVGLNGEKLLENTNTNKDTNKHTKTNASRNINTNTLLNRCL